MESNEQPRQVILSVIIPMKPVPLARPRFGKGRVFTKSTSRNAKAIVAGHLFKSMREQKRFTPFEGPLAVAMEFIFKRVKKPTESCRVYPCRSGDCDNHIKLCMDSGNGLVWKDDIQIVEIFARKSYGEKECIKLEVIQLKESKNG